MSLKTSRIAPNSTLELAVIAMPEAIEATCYFANPL